MTQNEYPQESQKNTKFCERVQSFDVISLTIRHDICFGGNDNVNVNRIKFSISRFGWKKRRLSGKWEIDGRDGIGVNILEDINFYHEAESKIKYFLQVAPKTSPERKPVEFNSYIQSPARADDWWHGDVRIRISQCFTISLRIFASL